MSDNDHEASYEYLCRTCGHHERKHAGYPLACVVCDSHNLLRTPLFREPKPGEYDIWARDQHIEVLKAEIDALRAENAALTAEREAVEKLLLDNGYGGAGFASLADAIDATLGELRRLERIVGVPQPERVTWERRVEEVLTQAEAAEAEREAT